MQPTVLITNQAPVEHFPNLPEIARLSFADHPNQLMPREQVLERVRDVEAIINQGELRVDATLLDAAPKLRIVANIAIGTDNLDLAAMAKRGVWGTNAPDAFTESTADCALALLLAVTRQIVQGDRYLRTGTWADDGFRPVFWEGPLLARRTIGIIGYGKIGKAVARRAEACGMRVLYHRRQDDGGDGYRPLTDLLREADVVSLHVPWSPETDCLINAETLAMMKPSSYLINLARGRVVDEPALVKALESGEIAGAGLDVFAKEPEIHPGLLKLRNVVITPHLGGAATDARRAARELAAENVCRVLKGERPRTPANTPTL